MCNGARDGPDAFYRGPIGEDIVKSVAAAGSFARCFCFEPSSSRSFGSGIPTTGIDRVASGSTPPSIHPIVFFRFEVQEILRGRRSAHLEDLVRPGRPSDGSGFHSRASARRCPYPRGRPWGVIPSRFGPPAFARNAIPRTTMSTTQATTSVAVTAGGILIQAEVMSLNDA